MKDKSNGAHYRIIDYLFSTDSKLSYTDYNELDYAALLCDPFKMALCLYAVERKKHFYL